MKTATLCLLILLCFASTAHSASAEFYGYVPSEPVLIYSPSGQVTSVMVSLYDYQSDTEWTITCKRPQTRKCAQFHAGDVLAVNAAIVKHGQSVEFRVITTQRWIPR